MTIIEKANAYDEAVENMRKFRNALNNHEETDLWVSKKDIVTDIEYYFPELKESEDEKMLRMFKEYLEGEIEIYTYDCRDDEDRQKLELFKHHLAWLEKQKQDDLTNYKKTLSNYDEAEKEKCDFVGDGFIKCYADFQDFKEGETYWFEYIGDDKYNVRSDNLLGKTYHITPCQLYTIFKKQTWLEKQGEQKFAEMDKDKVVIKKGKKPAWSEEDEKNLQGILDEIEANKSEAPEYDIDNYNRFIDWLKSLRPQNNITDEELAQAKKDAYNDALDKIEYHSGEPTFDDGWSAAIWYLKKKNAMPQTQWKPSEEQMDALESAVSSLQSTALESLYQNLKKL